MPYRSGTVRSPGVPPRILDVPLGRNGGGGRDVRVQMQSPFDPIIVCTGHEPPRSNKSPSIMYTRVIPVLRSWAYGSVYYDPIRKLLDSLVEMTFLRAKERNRHHITPRSGELAIRNIGIHLNLHMLLMPASVPAPPAL